MVCTISNVSAWWKSWEASSWSTSPRSSWRTPPPAGRGKSCKVLKACVNLYTARASPLSSCFYRKEDFSWSGLYHNTTAKSGHRLYYYLTSLHPNVTQIVSSSDRIYLRNTMKFSFTQSLTHSHKFFFRFRFFENGIIITILLAQNIWRLLMRQLWSRGNNCVKYCRASSPRWNESTLSNPDSQLKLPS